VGRQRGNILLLVTEEMSRQGAGSDRSFQTRFWDAFPPVGTNPGLVDLITRW
jgi:hypothetical protein